MSKQKNWKVRSHSEPIADTGDYDGYWEIVNDKGDSFRTSEDYDDIEEDLQKIADLLNSFDGALSLETACEINLHCDNMQLKMEIDQLKQPNDSPYQGSAGAVKILKQLCELKRYKDTLGKDSFYEKRQPELWKLANDFLNGIADSAASPAGDGLPPGLEEMIKREPVTFFLINALRYLDYKQRLLLIESLRERTIVEAVLPSPPNKSV